MCYKLQTFSCGHFIRSFPHASCKCTNRSIGEQRQPRTCRQWFCDKKPYYTDGCCEKSHITHINTSGHYFNPETGRRSGVRPGQRLTSFRAPRHRSSRAVNLAPPPYLGIEPPSYITSNSEWDDTTALPRQPQSERARPVQIVELGTPPESSDDESMIPRSFSNGANGIGLTGRPRARLAFDTPAEIIPAPPARSPPSSSLRDAFDEIMYQHLRTLIQDRAAQRNPVGPIRGTFNRSRRVPGGPAPVSLPTDEGNRGEQARLDFEDIIGAAMREIMGREEP
ncbi:hypothetical protein H072_9882 [Dactylellina haptotyla CBS 200.50]|uniref:Uncharacterized protein n=1 Tax=Dactylellina haptotyla (strain CBS 200.50) TaxID=1284197 RepID=S8A5Z4_DACHA|nr:hypothetical protein H072_9882 [Dactylellina haptotyla CBS 200.50]